MTSFLEFFACLFVTWLAYRFLRLAVADGVRDAIREIDGDGNAQVVAPATLEPESKNGVVAG